MKIYVKSLPLFIAMGALFAYLFHDGLAGVNVVVFDAVLLMVVLVVRPGLRWRPGFWLAVAGLLISAVAILIVNSSASIVAHAASFLILLGLAQVRELRFVWYLLLLGVSSLVMSGRRLWRQRRGPIVPPQHQSLVGRWLRQLAAPVALAAPFFLLYAIGNSSFVNGIDGFVESLLFWLEDTSLPYTFVLTLIGALLVVPFIYTGNEFGVTDHSGKYDDHLQRRRYRRLSPFAFNALMVEYRRGVLTLLLLNLLILVANLTDLRYLWITPGELTAATLSEYVHAGTKSLVVSIVLAMGYVLYFFRGNLNFYPDSSLLRKLTYYWLAQNAFLALSVGLRNWYYMSAYGLAYGRIYVAFLLLLILFGLFTLFRKVKFRLSFTYLMQVNGLALWFFLIGYGAVNWSGVITRVNLQQPVDRIDWVYLVREVDDRNAFLLMANQQLVPRKLRSALNRKQHSAEADAVSRDWRSWNYASWRNR